MLLRALSYKPYGYASHRGDRKNWGPTATIVSGAAKGPQGGAGRGVVSQGRQ